MTTFNASTSVSPSFADRSPAAAKVDNVLRRALKVRNPDSPEEVARALLERYRDQAGALENERTGLPVILQREPKPVTVATGAASFGPEIQQAYDDLDRDLHALIDNSQLKDIKVELNGWARAMRSAANDGLEAARFGLDPRQRDRVFAARRQLGEYSRLVRYVGAVSSDCNSLYRRLAQSCDVLAALMLVLAGDSLAAGGVTRGTVLLQTPAADLVEHRDRALAALRNLIGTSSQGFGPNDWPWGLESYRRLLARLEGSGQSDLRGLFHEPVLARALDELIDLAAGATADGLRALGSAALMTVQRLQRLISFAHVVLSEPPIGTTRLIPESPPLTTFLSSLALFVQSFDVGAGGSRLLYVARPTLIFYGLYGYSGPDIATNRLLALVRTRGILAELVDCHLDCHCERVSEQLMLDYVVYGLDRAIDLYALGSHPAGLGDPERRAAAYGAVASAFLGLFDQQPAEPELPDALEALLTEVETALQWPTVLDQTLFTQEDAPAAERERVARLIHSELCMQRGAERRWARLVGNLAPSCRRDLLMGETVVEQMLENALTEVRGEALPAQLGACPVFEVTLPPPVETSFDAFVNDNPVNGQQG